MSNNGLPVGREASSETIGDESLSSSQSRTDRYGSDGIADIDAITPPTSAHGSNVEPVATPASAVASLPVPRDGAQPRAPRRSRPSGASSNESQNAVELHELSHNGRRARAGGDNDNQSLSERRSSTSSKSTTSSWTSFLTGSISDTLKRPSSNWGLFLFLLHYFILVAFSIGLFCVGVLQYWAQVSSGAPNDAELTLVRMQKLFGELAHSDAEQAHNDATEMLAALAMTSEAESQWESIYDRLIEIVGACIDVANQTLTGTKCAELLKTAARNTTHDQNPDLAPSYALQKRKLAKIRLIFENHDVERHLQHLNDTSARSQAWLAFSLVIFLLSIAMIVIFLRKRLYRTFSDFRSKLVSPWHHHVVDEIAEKDLPEHRPGSSEESGISSALGNEANPVVKRLAGVPDAAHLPNNIWEVAAQGRLRETKKMKEEQPDFDVNQVHPRYGTLLAAAARSGNLDLVSYVLTLRVDTQKEGGQYHNALQSGASSGNPLVIRRLLNVGARDTSVGGYFGTALNAVSERATSEALVALLGSTSQPAKWLNEPGGLHGRALIAAASRRQLAMVKTLLGHGADVNGANESGETAIHAAASAKDLRIVEILLEKGADKNISSLAHGTALHVACRASSPEIALLLIRRGASVTVSDQNKRTALHEASRNGLADVVEAILAKDISTISHQDADYNSALHHAAISGHAKIAEILIDHDIDVSLGDKFQAQALFRAAGCRHPDVVRVLLEKGKANPNATDSFKQTALHGPAETEDVSVQRLLVQYNANVNARGLWNRTPLHEACNMARYNNVKLLLSRPDIDVNVVDDSQTTPLSRCLSSTDGRYMDQCVDPRIPLLILDYKEIECEDLGNGLAPDMRNGVDVNLCSGIVIQEAARRNLIDVVRKMVEEHAGNIHVPGGRYGGVMHAAAMGGDVELLSLLLERKANINLQGGEYGTPLAAAAAHGNVAAVELLVDGGADATIQGVGRYGTAYNSVCKALKIEEEGSAKIIALTSQIQSILSRAGARDGELTLRDLPHLKDRWQLMPNGYGWNAAGEL